MTLKEMLLTAEEEAPGDIYADSYHGDGYTAFYFDENKELWEGNHAIIYPGQIRDLSRVLDEIREAIAGNNQKRRQTLTAYLTGKVLAATGGRADTKIAGAQIEELIRKNQP